LVKNYDIEIQKKNTLLLLPSTSEASFGCPTVRLPARRSLFSPAFPRSVMTESYVKIFPALHVGWLVGWSAPNLCMSVPET